MRNDILRFLWGDQRDPIDRMIIATALAEEIPVLTSDRRFKSYRGLEVIG